MSLVPFMAHAAVALISTVIVGLEASVVYNLLWRR